MTPKGVSVGGAFGGDSYKVGIIDSEGSVRYGLDGLKVGATDGEADITVIDACTLVTAEPSPVANHPHLARQLGVYLDLAQTSASELLPQPFRPAHSNHPVLSRPSHLYRVLQTFVAAGLPRLDNLESRL